MPRLSHKEFPIFAPSVSLAFFFSLKNDQPKDKIEADCDRDFFMNPTEAVQYGIIDEVVTTKTSHIPKPQMPIL